MKNAFESTYSRVALVLFLTALGAAPAYGAGCDQFIPVYPCVVGTVQRLAASGTRFPAPSFKVTICTSSSGSGFCWTGTTDVNGVYAIQLTGQHGGNYWGFTWSDALNWGSSTQSFSPDTFAVAGCDAADGCAGAIVKPLSLPRPTAPALVAPAANVPVNNALPIALQWSGESDALRKSANWPIVYDVFLSSNGGVEASVATNVACCSTTLAAGALPAGSSIRWRAVAKMNTGVLPPPNQYYTTTSNTFAFSTLPDDFSIGVSPASATLNAGTSKQFTVSTATIRGPAQTIKFSAAGVPAGVFATFNPTSVTAGGSSTLTLNAVGNAGNATATVVVTGTGTTITHSVNVPLTVVANAFSMSVAPSPQTITAGQSATYTVGTALVSGLAQGVSLSVSGLPAGASPFLSPASVAVGQSSTLTITTSTATPAGSFPFTVLGSASSGPVYASGTLVVSAPKTPVVKIIWMQPGYMAGFGGATSLVIAGSVTNVPAGTRVDVIYDPWKKNVWYSAPSTTTDASGIFYTYVPNADFTDNYSAIAVSSGVQSPGCWTSPNSNRMTWCP